MSESLSVQQFQQVTMNFEIPLCSVCLEDRYNSIHWHIGGSMDGGERSEWGEINYSE